MGRRFGSTTTWSKETDLFSATTPNGTGEQLGLQVAYVHDDTRSPRLNIRHGLRARVWAEMFVDGVATASAAGGELSGPEQGWTFGTFGFDARRYVPLVGPSILALRLAGDWSLGQRKLLHMLGGTDHSLSLQGTANTRSTRMPFAYQARIAPLRGFQSNVRNGANVALANAEVRVPVFFSGAGRATSSSICKPWPLQTSVPAWTGLTPTRTRTPSILSPCSPTRSPSRQQQPRAGAVRFGLWASVQAARVLGRGRLGLRGGRRNHPATTLHFVPEF